MSIPYIGKTLIEFLSIPTIILFKELYFPLIGKIPIMPTSLGQRDIYKGRMNHADSCG